MIFEDAVLTTVGLAILARASATEPLLWTQARSTSTDLSALSTAQLEALTTLPEDGLEGVVSAVSALGSQATVTATLSNTESGAVHAVGLWGKIDGDAEETLVAVARAQAGTAVYLTASVSKPCRIFLDFVLAVDSASSISVSVAGAGYAPVSALEATNAAVQELENEVETIAPAILFRRAYVSLCSAENAGLNIALDVVDLVARRTIGETIRQSSGALVEPGYEGLIATDGARIFVVSTDTVIVGAYDVNSNTVQWLTDVVMSITSLSYGAGYVFVGHVSGTGSAKMTVLDAQTGDIVGSNPEVGNETVRALSYGSNSGNGFVARCNTGVGGNGTILTIYNMDDFSAEATYDHGDQIHWVAARSNLVAVCGISSFGHGNISLLDCSTLTAPSLIWTKETTDPMMSWCGFIGDCVAVIDRGGDDELKLFPTGRFASAPDALHTVAVNVAEGTYPVFGDFGCAYITSGSHQCMLVNALGQAICLSVLDEMMAVAWAGNQLVGVNLDRKLVSVSSTSRPVRVLQQFGHLALV